MPRILSLVAAAVVSVAAVAQESAPEHRPVRPKGRYFTQEQFQRALQGAKEDRASPPKSPDQPATPPPEGMKGLLDLAQQNPELMKSLLDAARDLVRDNPDLLRGDREDVAKKIAEQMGKQSNRGELLKQFDQKPPPANVKRKPSEKSDQKGRRTRRKSPEQKEGGQEQEPRPDTREPQGDPRPQPRRDPDAEAETPKPSKNLLEDMAAQSPDFMKSLLEQAKKRFQTGNPPTKEQVDEAVSKAADAVKDDPGVAPWLNDPKTQEKLESPEFREAVRKMLAQQPLDRRQRDPLAQRPDRAPKGQPTEREDSREPQTPDRPQQSIDAERQPPGEQLSEANPLPRPTERKRRRPVEPLTNDDLTKRADDARKRVAKEMADANAKPGDRAPEPKAEPEPRSPDQSQPAQAGQPEDAVGRMTEMLKQNPGLVESLLKSAGPEGPKGADQETRESLKGLLESLKGTEIEKQAREFAKELNKDGALNDLLKGTGREGARPRSDETAPPRDRRREDPARSASEEATKAFKALAGEDFNASKLGDTMKSLGEAIKKQATSDERSSFNRPAASAARPADEGLGDGWLGMFGRGAAKVGEWSAKASQSIAQNVAPPSESSRINPPSFSELKSLTLPSAEAGGKTLLVLGIVAALGVGAWMLLKRPEAQVAGGPLFAKLPKLSLAGLPPREQAALLFERAALERLGEPARPKNHVTLAEKLCNGPTSDAHVLADVYEAARYTPPTDPFPADQVGVVRELIARTGTPPKSVDGGK